MHKVTGVTYFPGDSIPDKHQKPQNAQEAWSMAFEQTGWKLDVETNPKELPDPEDPAGEWTIGELQQALYAVRIRSKAAQQKKDREAIELAKKDQKGENDNPANNEQTQNDDDLGTKIESAEATLHKRLEKMTQLEIQEFIPGLVTVEDPLDKEWVYELLCVQKIKDFDRGVMFDTYGSDSENLPREGAAVAAEWTFGDDARTLQTALKQQEKEAPPGENDPSAEPTNEAKEIKLRWGNANNKELQSVNKAYFRVGVHEVGHAMGLDHNFKDHGFMNTTDTIAEDDLTAQRKALEEKVQSAGVSPKVLEQAQKIGVLPGRFRQVDPFPGFIGLHFQADDLNRLRFGADVAIRPGTSFQDFGPLFGDVSPTPAEGLSLEASPLLDAVPFGAPVRINVKITNTSDKPQKGPISLSLKSGVVTGSVIDPQRNERYFWPLKKSEDSDPGGVLAPWETRTYALTLMRGPQKALFPMVGDHLVKITAEWPRDRKSVYLEAAPTRIRVTAPVDDNHRAAALKVMSTPDTLFSLAIVGDHLTEGNEAVKAALANPILSPHFALIRAKLLLIGPREIDPDEACELIDDAVVMSFDEIDSLSSSLWKVCGPPKGKQFDHEKLKNAVSALKHCFRILHAKSSIDKVRSKKVTKCLDDLDTLAQPTVKLPIKPQDLSTASAEFGKVRRSATGRYLDKIKREVAAEANEWANQRLRERLLSEMTPSKPPGTGK
jgi:hypothetical protein